MSFGDSITQGFGNFGNALFPTDPSLGVDPAVQKAAQGRAMLQLGLGMLAGANHGIGPAAFSALQGASQDYTGAMDNAYKHTLLKRQSDYQQQEHDRQAKLQQQQDRQTAAATATRVASGLQNPAYAQNPAAYWDLVKNNPDVQSAMQQAGVQIPQDMGPDGFKSVAQQLGTFGQMSAAPTAPRDLNLKAVMGPNGKPILVPEVQAVGQQPYEKAPEQQLSRFSRPVEGGKVQDFMLDAHTGIERPLGAPYAPSAKNTFSDQSSALLASLASKGVALPAGMRSKEQQVATMNGLLTKFPDLSPDEIADKVAAGQIGFGAAKKEITVAAGQAGKVSVAANELKTFGDQALEASAAVLRGNFIPLSKLLQMKDSSISDPALLRFKVKMQALNSAYDQLSARGGTDTEKRAHIHELFQTAAGPEAVQILVQALREESDGALAAAAKAQEYHPPGTVAPAATGSASDADILKKWGG